MGVKKGAWEKPKLLEAKKNSKPMWDVIKEILGKTKSKEEQMYIYSEDGTKHKAQDVFMEAIYRRLEKGYLSKIPKINT